MRQVIVSLTRQVGCAVKASEPQLLHHGQRSVTPHSSASMPFSIRTSFTVVASNVFRSEVHPCTDPAACPAQ